MSIDQQPQLSDGDLRKIAMLVVEECETAFSSLACSLKDRLAAYPDDLHYRALAIGLIYMLANHLRHHASLTSIEESVELAMEFLERHLNSEELKIDSGSKYWN